MGIALVIALCCGLVGYVGMVHKRFPLGIHPLVYEAVTFTLCAFVVGRLGCWWLLAFGLVVIVAATVVDPYLWKSNAYFPVVTSEVRLLSLKVNGGLGLIAVVAFGLGALSRVF